MIAVMTVCHLFDKVKNKPLNNVSSINATSNPAKKEVRTNLAVNVSETSIMRMSNSRIDRTTTARMQRPVTNENKNLLKKRLNVVLCPIALSDNLNAISVGNIPITNRRRADRVTHLSNWYASDWAS